MLASSGFYIALGGICVALLLGGYEKIFYALKYGHSFGLYTGYGLNTAVACLSSKALFFLLPILVTLPYSTAIVEDFQSGYIRFYLPRSGRKKYIRGKIVVNAFAVMLALLLAVVIVLAFLFVLMLPQEGMIEQEDVSIVEQQLDMDAMLFSVFVRVFLLLLSASLWSSISVLFAAVTINKYISYIAPFIVYYLLIIFCERYFKSLSFLHSQQWLYPIGYSVWMMALIVLALTTSVMFAIYAVLKRRLFRV